MALQSAENLLKVFSQVWAVVPPNQKELEALLLQSGCTVLINPNAHIGMGTSVALAACQWQQRTEFESLVIALGDMPFIQTSTLQALANELEKGASICAPVFSGQRGQPVGFSKKWQAQLMSLTGDVGARDLIRAHSADMTLIPVNDVGIHLDIDTPAHLVFSSN